MERVSVRDPQRRFKLPPTRAGFWSNGATRSRIWEWGLRNSNLALDLYFIILHPKSEVYNPKFDEWHSL